MSWMQRLCETYDACFGQPQFEQAPLAPIDHVEQQAHIEIVLDEDGAFVSASVVLKENTLIPATEESAGRTSGAVAHPLCDKLRYVACDYGSSDHRLYLHQLRAWAEHAQSPKLNAVLSYVQKGQIVHDLVAAGVLQTRSDDKLETVWAAGPSPLAKLLTAHPKTKERDQGNALIRWRVLLPNDLESAVWRDPKLQQDWAAFNATLPATRGLCFSSGVEEALALSHPKRLRHGGDGAKLISTNDSSGFTYLGRFGSATEAYGLSSASTQKAHNALRWLIARQGARSGEQVVVAWAVQTAEPLPVVVATSDLPWLIEEDADNGNAPEQETSYGGDAGQSYAKQLSKAVRGYQAKLGERTDIVVMALDSATPGRMAIPYYRELKGFEFLERLEKWHLQFAWPQNFGKDNHFTGAPAPRDIAEAAYGRRVDDKLRKSTVERLLPCIVDSKPLPRDLELATVRRATNRVALERWEFERVLGIACSLVRGANPKEQYTMSLDDTRNTRDYLYGRLLAIADSIEEVALRAAGEDRDTNAARLMQRFADHPYTTWRTLELQLRPYIARLRSSRPGALFIRQKLLDEIPGRFPVLAEGASSFTDNRRLEGEFLLGYHSQREELRRKKTSNESATEEQDQTEGENL